MAEFYPELSEKQQDDRVLSLQLAGLQLAAMLDGVGKSIADVTGIPKVLMSNSHEPVALPSAEQLVQTLVEKYGINPDKLRITVVDQVAVATPDLDIGVSTVEPANPVFAAMSAMTDQFEHPSLRMVNKQDRSKP